MDGPLLFAYPATCGGALSLRSASILPAWPSCLAAASSSVMMLFCPIRFAASRGASPLLFLACVSAPLARSDVRLVAPLSGIVQRSAHS